MIPMIDLAAWRASDPTVVTAVDAALRQAGFLLVSGHGVGDAVAAEVRAAARRFFALPAEVKYRYAVRIGGRGWLAPGVEANGRVEGAVNCSLKRVTAGASDTICTQRSGAKTKPGAVLAARRVPTELNSQRASGSTEDRSTPASCVGSSAKELVEDLRKLVGDQTASRRLRTQVWSQPSAAMSKSPGQNDTSRRTVESPPELKESFAIGPSTPTGDRRVDDVWFPPNVWPAEAPEPPGVARRYVEAMCSVSTRLLELCADALGQPLDSLTALAGHPTWTFNINRYPPLVEVGEPVVG